MSTLLSARHARVPVRSILTTLTVAVALPLAAMAPQPAAAQTVDPSLLDGLTYRSVNFTRGGRVTAIAGHAAQPNTFYFGATGGGVFKTTDAGESWEPISDQQIATGSIGAIDVARTNPNIVYVGTGSAAIRSNVIVGKGVWRSDDAGENWRHVGLPDVGQIGELVIHPMNPDVVFVAAVGQPFGPNPERGVYRTRNG
ncbi:MAG: glycosyl hydrolase, partial [Gemmatimonadota bacterium]